jgi:hypothetical protein
MAYGDKLADQPQVVSLKMVYADAGIVFGGFKTYWYFSATNPSASVLNELASHASSAWGTNMSPTQHPSIALIEVVAQDLTSRSAFQGVWSGSVAGTSSGSQLPLDNCVLINYTLHHRYRGGKPRSYLPIGTAIDTSDGHTWTPAFVTQVTNSFGAWRNAIVADTGGIQIANQAAVHFYKGPITNPNASEWAPRNVPKLQTVSDNENIYGMAVATRIAQQRRRIPEVSA